MRGSGKGSLGQSLLRSLKSTQSHQDLSFFGTMTRLASQSVWLISLMNPVSSSLASSSLIACRLGSENRRSVCLAGLNPFIILRLCSANLRGISGMSKGCQESCPNFRAGTLVGRRRPPNPAVLQWMLFCSDSSGALGI